MTDRRTIAATLPPVLQRYCELREGLGQVCSLIAVMARVKPVVDDWIPADRVGAMGRVASSLGLAMASDETFVFLEEGELDGIAGGELLNTTRARMADESAPDGLVHVYLGREPAEVDAARRSGWYGLVAGGRVVPKPPIDHYWLGRLLGYPECCLASFARSGAWNVANPYAEASRSTSAPHPLCNPVMRHTGLSYVAHYPCTFDCARTVEYGDAVRRAVHACSQRLGQAADAAVTGPFLLLSGWSAFSFSGVATGPTAIRYERVRPAPTNRVDAGLAALLEAGNEVEVRGDVVVVLRDGRAIGTHHVRADRYAPEHAVVVDFRAELLRPAEELVAH